MNLSYGNTAGMRALVERATQNLTALMDDEREHGVPEDQRQWRWSVECLQQVIESMGPYANPRTTPIELRNCFAVLRADWLTPTVLLADPGSLGRAAIARLCEQPRYGVISALTLHDCLGVNARLSHTGWEGKFGEHPAPMVLECPQVVAFSLPVLKDTLFKCLSLVENSHRASFSEEAGVWRVTVGKEHFTDLRTGLVDLEATP